MTRSRVKNDFAVGIDDNATSTAITVDSSENVGIGETNPAAKLHVDNNIRVNGAAPTIQLGESDSTDSNYQIRVSGGQLRFQANNDAFDSASTKITMSPTGRLGINETNPDVHLHLTNTTAPVMKFERNDTAVAQGNGIGQIQFAHREAGNEGVAATLRVEAKDGVGRGAFVFQTGLAGTVTETIRVDSDGIKFGGETAAANALDDYEEGNWLPTPKDLSDNAATFTTRVGYYVKIGRLVYVTVDLVNINTTGCTSTNAVLIKGLPFTPVTGAGNTYHTGIAAVGGAVAASENVIGVRISENVDYIVMAKGSQTLMGDLVKFQDMGSGTADIRFSMSYYTNA